MPSYLVLQEEYFEYLCKKDFVHTKTSPLIPIELSLTTYGISGILPGDIFNIDYLFTTQITIREKIIVEHKNV